MQRNVSFELNFGLDHMKLELAVREELFEGISHAIVDNGGIITVYYTMDLELARK